MLSQCSSYWDYWWRVGLSLVGVAEVVHTVLHPLGKNFAGKLIIAYMYEVVSNPICKAQNKVALT